MSRKALLPLLSLLGCGCGAPSLPGPCGPADARDRQADARQVRLAWDEAERVLREERPVSRAERVRVALQVGDAVEAIDRLERAGQLGADGARLLRELLRQLMPMVNPPPVPVGACHEPHVVASRRLGLETMGQWLPLFEKLAASGAISPGLLCRLLLQLEQGIAALEKEDPRPTGVRAHNREVFRERLARLKICALGEGR